MDAAGMDAILAYLRPDEIRDALWLIDVFERWNMPPEEGDEWRRRILAMRAFLELDFAESRWS